MSVARPVVGIMACSRQQGPAIAQTVTDRYLEACVRHADCAALLVPARPDLFSAAEVASRLDGLFLTGSPSNVEPTRYGDATAGDGPFDPGRDEMSIALIDAMIHSGRPVLGVCRGFQELNVAFGGTLVRDVGHTDRFVSHHGRTDAPLDELFGHKHEVTLNRDGRLARALSRAELTVNSVHYQGIGRLGADLVVEATAPDGLIEAFSAKVNGAPVLGVQWHPEWQTDHDAASSGLFCLFGKLLRGDADVWD